MRCDKSRVPSRRAAPSCPLMNELHRYLMPPPKVGDQRFERGDETEIVERGRVQETREITNAVQRAVSAGLRVGKQRGRAPIRSMRRSATASCLGRAQRLPNFVVQLACDAALLLFTSLDQPRRETLQSLAIRSSRSCCSVSRRSRAAAWRTPASRLPG